MTINQEFLNNSVEATSDLDDQLNNGTANRAERLIKNITESVNSIEDKNVSIIAIPQRKAKGLPPFGMIFFDSLLRAIEDHNLQMRDMKVFFKYASLMEYGNEIKVTQIEVAKELNLSRQAVSSAVKHLLDAELLIKDESDSLLMNWRCIAKGKLKDFQDADNLAKAIYKADSRRGGQRVNVTIKNASVINIAGSVVSVGKESSKDVHNEMDKDDNVPF